MGLTAAALLCLCACSLQQPHGVPHASPSRVGSEQTIIGQAGSVYAHYLDASKRLTQSGGADVASMKPYVTDAMFKDAESFAKFLRQKHLHTVGSTRSRHLTLQQYDKAVKKASFYVCDDSASSRLIDDRGKDVTPEDRVDVQTLLVTFDTGTTPIRISGSEVWSGTSVC